MKNKYFLLPILATLCVCAMLGCPDPGPGPAKNVTVTFDPSYTDAESLKFTIPKNEALGSSRYTQVIALQDRTGYIFGGWATTQNGDPVAVTADSKWTANTTYYGLWEQEVPPGEDITITYNLNGFPGTAPTAITLESGEAIGPTNLPALSALGYTWLGWATTTDGTVINMTASFTANQTLYARYIPPAQGPITVDIDMSTGTLDTDFTEPTKAVRTTEIRAKENEAAYYTFEELFVTNDVNNLYVAMKISPEFGGWNPDSIILLIDNVSSEADIGKTPSAANNNDKIATTETINGTVEARVYMRMRDWAQGPQGVVGASQNITTWTQDSSDWVFRPTAPANPQAVKFSIPLSEIANAVAGTELKIFANFSMGWGSGDSRAAPMPGSFAPEAAVTDFEDETEGSSTITVNMANALSYLVKEVTGGNIILMYDRNGVSGASPGNKAVKSGTAIGENALPTLTATGWDFLGWATTTDGTPIAATATFTANQTLYARWERSDITITYDLNGFPGTAPANYTAKHSTAIGEGALPALTETAGYTFMGWATTASGNVIDATATFTANTTLYARWTGGAITITYDLNGFPGTAPTDFSALSGVAIGADALPALSAADYTWLGWAETTDGVPVNASAFFTTNTTLYARYVQAQATFADIDMATGTLDADFSDSTKAASSTDKGTVTKDNTSNNYQIEGLYVANDATNLYVALDFGTGKFPAGYNFDRLVIWIDNTAVSTGGGDTDTMKIAQNQAITGSIEASVYKRNNETLGGTAGAAINVSAWSTPSNDNGWFVKPDTPMDAQVIKFSIPLANIGNAASGNELKVVAAYSQGWTNGGNIVMGGIVPKDAFKFSSNDGVDYYTAWDIGESTGVNYITVDMSAALSYTVK